MLLLIFELLIKIFLVKKADCMFIAVSFFPLNLICISMHMVPHYIVQVYIFSEHIMKYQSLKRQRGKGLLSSDVCLSVFNMAVKMCFL